MAPANLPNAVNFWGHGNISAGFCYCTFCLHILLATHGFLVVNILGISAFYHDSAAAILVDGEIVAAAQEERFSRKKHDPDFPENAIKYVNHAITYAPKYGKGHGPINHLNSINIKKKFR